MPEIQVKDKLITLEELGVALNNKAGGCSWNINTENTTDTRVLVLTNGSLQHRVLPSWLNNINTVPVDHGGTNATTPDGARTNLGIHSGTAVETFTNGSVTLPFSKFGLNSKPDTFVVTLSSRDGFIRYDWDYSASNIVLVCLDSNKTPVTGDVRFSWIAIP